MTPSIVICNAAGVNRDAGREVDRDALSRRDIAKGVVVYPVGTTTTDNGIRATARPAFIGTVVAGQRVGEVRPIDG